MIHNLHIRRMQSMEYREYRETYYIRMDRGDEIISNIIEICKKHKIASAVFSGIGGCGKAEIQTFIPEKGTFETQLLEGMLELVSLNGNVIIDSDGLYFHHTHAMLTYKCADEHRFAGGHMKSLTVLYTAEIELRPVIGGVIGRRLDLETRTGLWNFEE